MVEMQRIVESNPQEDFLCFQAWRNIWDQLGICPNQFWQILKLLKCYFLKFFQIRFFGDFFFKFGTNLRTCSRFESLSQPTLKLFRWAWLLVRFIMETRCGIADLQHSNTHPHRGHSTTTWTEFCHIF